MNITTLAQNTATPSKKQLSSQELRESLLLQLPATKAACIYFTVKKRTSHF